MKNYKPNNYNEILNSDDDKAGFYMDLIKETFRK